MEHLIYWLAIARLSSFSIEGSLVLLQEFGGFEKAWTADREKLFSIQGDGGLARDIAIERDSIALSDYDRMLYKSTRLGIKTVTAISNEYPSKLRRIDDPPPTLFVLGNKSVLQKEMIAIVGTRTPTDFGELKSRELALNLAKKGYVIVSGLALGIDSNAHLGALEGDGLTVAVLPSSLENITPKKNEPLAYDIIRHNGAVISEYAPDQAVTKRNFIHRNRIIAALAEATVIIEGTKRSGTRHQARYAAEFGRLILTLKPKDPSLDVAELPLMLVEEGAKPIESASDVEAELWKAKLANTKQETLV
ncbi:MAG: DNA-processing protein DprA [Candidatus Thorarchaeota archaeon]